MWSHKLLGGSVSTTYARLSTGRVVAGEQEKLLLLKRDLGKKTTNSSITYLYFHLHQITADRLNLNDITSVLGVLYWVYIIFHLTFWTLSIILPFQPRCKSYLDLTQIEMECVMPIQVTW